MRQIIAATALALAVATPAFAQVSQDWPVTDPLSENPRIRGEQEWWRLVAQANAYRLAHEQPQQQQTVPQHAAISNGASASDATMGSAGARTGTSPNVVAPQDSCPGTNAAGQPWQQGQYCLPGGR